MKKNLGSYPINLRICLCKTACRSKQSSDFSGIPKGHWIASALRASQRRSIIFILTSCLTACSWFGQPPKPQVNIPHRFPSSSALYPSQKNLPYVAWWQQFKDPELNALMTKGLNENLDIHIAASRLEQSQGELRQIQLTWIPLIMLMGGYSTNPALGNIGRFIGVWPTYSINILQQMKSQEFAEYQVEYMQAMVSAVRLTVIGQITTAYFTLIEQQEQLKLLNVFQRDFSSLITLTKQEIKIGLKNDLDLAKLVVDSQLVETRIKAVQQNIVVSQNALRLLLNQNPGLIKTHHNFSKLDFSRFRPGTLPTTVLRNRPDFMMAEFALKRAYTGVAIAYSNFFPMLQLDQFIGDSSIPQNTLESATDAYVNWVIQPNTFGKVMAQKGVYKAQVYQFIQTIRKIFNEVDNALSGNQKYNAYYLDSLHAFQAQQHKYDLQTGLLKAGLISYKDLLQDKLILDELALIKNQAKLDLAISMVVLYQDLAGGYRVNLGTDK